MAEGIGEILTYAVGVAISPVPIIAVILMLFSTRARVNGPMFLAGWVVALGVVSAVAYAARGRRRRRDRRAPASDTVSWGKIAVGVFFLLVAAQAVARPAGAGRAARDAEVDGGHRRVLARQGVHARAAARGREPEEPPALRRRRRGARPARPRRRRTRSSRWIVYVVLGSITIAGPVVYYLVGGDRAQDGARLDEGVARRAQRRGDDGAVPRLRRQADRRGPPRARRLRQRRARRAPTRREGSRGKGRGPRAPDAAIGGARGNRLLRHLHGRPRSRSQGRSRGPRRRRAVALGRLASRCGAVRARSRAVRGHRVPLVRRRPARPRRRGRGPVLRDGLPRQRAAVRRDALRRLGGRGGPRRERRRRRRQSPVLRHLGGRRGARPTSS